jgi:hypothetical protein
MTALHVYPNATNEESAAVAAVVAQVLAEEAELFARPPARPRQSDWVLAWRPQIPPLAMQPQRPFALPSPDEAAE